MKDIELNFKFKGMDRLPKLLQRVPDITRKEMKIATTQATLLIERETKELTPQGVGGAASGLVASITAKPVNSFSSNVIGVVSTSSPYAIPVELGTKPHVPPLTPLMDWAKVKLGVSDEDIFGVALAIQRKIASRGTLAVGMFHRAFNENKKQIESFFNQAVERIENQIVSGAR